jgi:hypothetical protein
MKTKVRDGADEKAARSFSKDCKKTGGGQAPRQPRQLDPDQDGVSDQENYHENSYLPNLSSSPNDSQGSHLQVFRDLTNNKVPLQTEFDDAPSQVEVSNRQVTSDKLRTIIQL